MPFRRWFLVVLLGLSVQGAACSGRRGAGACRNDNDCGPESDCRSGTCVRRAPAPGAAAAGAQAPGAPVAGAPLAPAPAPRAVYSATAASAEAKTPPPPVPGAQVYAPMGPHIPPPRPGQRIERPTDPHQRSPFVPSLDKLPAGADPTTYFPPSL